MKPNESQVGEGLTRGPKAKKKKESFEQRQRKISTEDLLAQDSALIGANLKDFINEETFNNLPIQQQVCLYFFILKLMCIFSVIIFFVRKLCSLRSLSSSLN